MRRNTIRSVLVNRLPKLGGQPRMEILNVFEKVAALGISERAKLLGDSTGPFGDALQPADVFGNQARFVPAAARVQADGWRGRVDDCCELEFLSTMT
jgi:hypothetical protein